VVQLWHGRRPFKEMLSDAHKCTKTGSKSEIYFASSFCYWIPATPWDPAQVDGLTWADEQERGMCGSPPLGTDQCMRCAICHNNARDYQHELKTYARWEPVPLPGGCLTDVMIRDSCVGEANQLNEGLKMNYDLCTSLRDSFENANAAMLEAEQTISALDMKVHNELPNRRQELMIERDHTQEAMADARRMMSRMKRRSIPKQCDAYADLTNKRRALRKITKSNRIRRYDIEQLAARCQRPREPKEPKRPESKVVNEDGASRVVPPTDDQMQKYQDRMRDYKKEQKQLPRKQRVYEQCQECHRVTDRFLEVLDKYDHAQALSEELEQRLQVVEAERQEAMQQRSHLAATVPTLQQNKMRAEQAWVPQKVGCLQAIQEYDNQVRKHTAMCAPKMWAQSCEKACLERTAQHGCARVEGTPTDQANTAGGITIKCQPPQPSWVRAPYDMGVPPLNPQAQCSDITRTQAPVFMTPIRKEGWLWKNGRFSGYNKRYFAFEQGHMHRSAMMRYWVQGNPHETAGARERLYKAIIVWDIKDVEDLRKTQVIEGEPRWCFKATLFYRTYTLCAETQQERDEWVSLIIDAMSRRHPENDQ